MLLCIKTENETILLTDNNGDKNEYLLKFTEYTS